MAAAECEPVAIRRKSWSAPVTAARDENAIRLRSRCKPEIRLLQRIRVPKLESLEIAEQALFGPKTTAVKRRAKHFQHRSGGRTDLRL